MRDKFTPLDISGAFNAGAGNYEGEEAKRLWPARDESPNDTPLVNLPWGEQQFWGVPFNLAEKGADQSIVLVAQKAKGEVGDSASVVVGGRHAERTAAVVESIRSTGRSAAPAIGDVADSTQAEHLVATALTEFGGLDIVVNARGTIVALTALALFAFFTRRIKE